MPNLPIMPFIALILLILPIKLAPQNLLKLAFALWMIGGLVLSILGVNRLLDPSLHLSTITLAITIGLALIIGFGKGKFVLSKTSARNIDRINEMTESAKPIHVYSIRSWIIIALMVLISVSLTVFNAPLFWRGAINLTIGFALIMSSLAYLQAPRLTPSNS